MQGRSSRDLSPGDMEAQAQRSREAERQSARQLITTTRVLRTLSRSVGAQGQPEGCVAHSGEGRGWGESLEEVSHDTNSHKTDRQYSWTDVKGRRSPLINSSCSRQGMPLARFPPASLPATRLLSSPSSPFLRDTDRSSHTRQRFPAASSE